MYARVMPNRLAEVVQQVEDLAADRDVQRGHWLVEHQEARTDADGPGDRHPLALAAGQLVGIAAAQLRGESDEVQELGRAGRELPPCKPFDGLDRLGDQPVHP